MKIKCLINLPRNFALCWATNETNFNFTFARCEVLPFYGNTHTTTSVTSLQTTLFRHEARDIFRNATNAAEEDAVIFTGSGTTAAVHKLISALNINEVIK